MKEEDIVNFYIDNGLLISPDTLSIIKETPLPLNTKFSVINKDTLNIILKKSYVDIAGFEKAIVMKEKHRNTKLYEKFMNYLNNDNIHTETQNSINASTIKEKDKNTPKHVDTQRTTTQIKPETESSKETKEIKETKDIIGVPTEKSIAESKWAFMEKSRIKILSSYNTKSRKWSVQDFVSLYNARFKELEKILRQRSELQNLTSISRIVSKKERENVSLVGVVYEKGVTKTGNLMLTLEDPTGTVKVVINKSKEELFKLAEEIQLDETIGVVGMFDQIIFANSLYIPDIPLTKELKKSPEEGYFVVIADTEPGSKLFLEKEFNKFIAWLNEEIGTEKQREVASKVKYIFIGGDLVNGVGIYPNQEFDLNILDIKDQYAALADLLKKIPQHIPIIICPGNHDVGRISEPQPPLGIEYAAPLISLPNVISVSNPATINIYAQPESGFDGFDIMFYHGFSFVYYSENVPAIRRLGGQKRPDLIMKYLLQRRHLAPSHTSTLYIPDPKRDPLVIDKVPDFLLSGHVHRAMVSNYKNVTCINASCWTAQSEEQERRGLEAQPARAFIVDMNTREVKIMNFMSKDEPEKGVTDNVEATSSQAITTPATITPSTANNGV